MVDAATSSGEMNEDCQFFRMVRCIPAVRATLLQTKIKYFVSSKCMRERRSSDDENETVVKKRKP